MLKILKVDHHTFTCKICKEMAKRGYRKEQKYWDDFFNDELKPIKYKLIFCKNEVKLK